MGRAQAGARARPLLYCALLHADILPPQRGEWSPGGPRRQSLCRHCTEKHTATVTGHYLPENCPFIAPSAARSATAGGFICMEPMKTRLNGLFILYRPVKRETPPAQSPRATRCTRGYKVFYDALVFYCLLFYNGNRNRTHKQNRRTKNRRNRHVQG